MEAKGKGAREWRVEIKGKSTHGHLQQCGGCEGGGIRGLNVNGKIQLKCKKPKINTKIIQ